jgi:hypothetical protein
MLQFEAAWHEASWRDAPFDAVHPVLGLRIRPRAPNSQAAMRLPQFFRYFERDGFEEHRRSCLLHARYSYKWTMSSIRW